MNSWKEISPPQDGTPIVAIGRTIFEDEFSTNVIPWTAAIFWVKDSSGYEGWHYLENQLTVVRCLGDELRIDFWLEHPTVGIGGLR
jgi:hypothetical protein